MTNPSVINIIFPSGTKRTGSYESQVKYRRSQSSYTFLFSVRAPVDRGEERSVTQGRQYRDHHGVLYVCTGFTRRRIQKRVHKIYIYAENTVQILAVHFMNISAACVGNKYRLMLYEHSLLPSPHSCYPVVLYPLPPAVGIVFLRRCVQPENGWCVVANMAPTTPQNHPLPLHAFPRSAIHHPSLSHSTFIPRPLTVGLQLMRRILIEYEMYKDTHDTTNSFVTRVVMPANAVKFQNQV
ncbi:uncharacterized protein LOC135162128 isoform X1 [Diachasmimorpha longicaudata]|uniref:uncharacterized protein LOC135162128 isoform X1 n=1 Tax=Diachasmimorpha longicaudata TaxID=58733 RepID=UPI0030B8F643